ncbi:MAG: hypothetical protein QNJ64_12430 [Crocosphaera sp.]|nr:hypothetical protein [Crocosphaera sp.]
MKHLKHLQLQEKLLVIDSSIKTGTFTHNPIFIVFIVLKFLKFSKQPQNPIQA